MSRWLAAGVLLISAIVACGQDTRPANELAWHDLTGPVHVVQQDDYIYDGANARKTGTTVTVFDEKGFTVEGSHYDAGGRLDSHTKLEHKGASVLKSETTATDPQQARTVTTKEDELGWPTEMEIWTGGERWWSGRRLRRRW